MTEVTDPAANSERVSEDTAGGAASGGTAGDAAALDELRNTLCRVIEGKPAVVDRLLVAVLAEGAVLLEDVPGVGKTTLAKALAAGLDLEFRRVQFTPDLLPADVIGSPIFHPQEGRFSFREGPVFTNVLLADEINRASPRTQSALLEAMAERQVTVDGEARDLPSPFLVLATQNPIDFRGTYPLPEAQLDRFFLRLSLGYPAGEDELRMLYAQKTRHPLEDVRPVLDGERLRAMQRRVRDVHVEESVGRYIVSLAEATRRDERVELGISPRGSLMLFLAAQANAFLAGRDFATPDDVQELAEPVWAHRMLLTTGTKAGGGAAGDVVADVLRKTRVPK